MRIINFSRNVIGKKRMDVLEPLYTNSWSYFFKKIVTELYVKFRNLQGCFDGWISKMSHKHMSSLLLSQFLEQKFQSFKRILFVCNVLLRALYNTLPCVYLQIESEMITSMACILINGKFLQFVVHAAWTLTASHRTEGWWEEGM